MQFADAGGDLGEIVEQLAALEPGEPLQAELEDAARLRLAEIDHVPLDAGAGFGEPIEPGGDVGRRPGHAHELGPRLCGVGTCTDQGDDAVDVLHRDDETGEQVGLLARFFEIEAGAAEDHLLAEGDEGFERLPKAEEARPPMIERQHVDAEARLKLGVAEELVEHDLRRGFALELDHHPEPLAIALVAEIGDALDLLVAHELGDALEQGGLVHLIGDLAHHDGEAVAADLLDLGAGADDDRAPPAGIGPGKPAPPENDAPGGKVGAGDDLHQGGKRKLGVVDQGERGVDHLARIVGRDVGRHADRDPARPIHEEIGEGGGEDGGFLLALVVIGLEIDRVLVDVGEQRHGDRGEARLGVAHRRRRVAIDRAEIALPVDQRQPHGEALRHADHGVVDRRIAVGVVFPHHVAHDARGFAVRLVGRPARFHHRIEDPPVHRLEPVAHVGERPAHDHRHRVVEVGAAHLLLDRHRHDVVVRTFGVVAWFFAHRPSLNRGPAMRQGSAGGGPRSDYRPIPPSSQVRRPGGKGRSQLRA